jgi:calcineurin-like phosphoesterase family protein
MIVALTKEWAELKGRVFFSSDTHYSHLKILEYCPNRAYANVGDMNEALIAAHNAVVSADDTYLHIGDFAMGQASTHAGIMARLNGYKILVRGNHDRSHQTMLKVGFNESCDTLMLKNTPHGLVWAEHVPCLTHKGDIHLCGHVHQRWSTHPPRIVNAGVDVNDLMPRMLTELVLKLDALPSTPPT